VKIFIIFLIFGITLSACLNTNNSSSGDAAPNSATALIGQALSEGNCLSCHATYSLATTNQEMVAIINAKSADEVILGAPDLSGLYIRITGGGAGKSKMPPSENLRQETLDLFYSWLESLEEHDFE
jgi:mono/diheme cytochrome c family protein